MIAVPADDTTSTTMRHHEENGRQKFRKIKDNHWKEHDYYNNKPTTTRTGGSTGGEKAEPPSKVAAAATGCKTNDDYEEPFTFELFGRNDNSDDDEEDNMLYFTFRGRFVSRQHLRQQQEAKDRATCGAVAASPQYDETFNSLTLTLSGESLCYHTRVLKSTGLAVWSGEDVARYFIRQRMNVLCDKSVWELGAGTGIFGMTAIALGTRQVILTDGDSTALTNLRENIKRNINCCLGIKTETPVSEVTDSSDNKSRSDESAKGVAEDADGDEESDHEAIDHNGLVHCPQLIWGDVDAARRLIKRYGPPDVLVASDVIYMPASLDPFWQTVAVLLSRSKKKEKQSDPTEDKNDGNTENANDDYEIDDRHPLLYFMNNCPSQLTFEQILEGAERHGLEEVDCTSNTTPPLPYPHLHIFRVTRDD